MLTYRRLKRWQWLIIISILVAVLGSLSPECEPMTHTTFDPANWKPMTHPLLTLLTESLWLNPSDPANWKPMTHPFRLLSLWLTLSWLTSSWPYQWLHSFCLWANDSPVTLLTGNKWLAPLRLISLHDSLPPDCTNDSPLFVCEPMTHQLMTES